MRAASITKVFFVEGNPKSKPPYAKRVDEVSAGGLVVDTTGKLGLLIWLRDQKDASGKEDS